MKQIREFRIEIYGRVQGVNFRVMVREHCDKLGLKGYAMNREAGSVLLVVQGEGKEIDSLICWIKENPGMSKVDKVIVEEKDLGGEDEEFKGFEIVRGFIGR